MIEQFLQAIMEQLKEPKADLEKNLRALLAEMVSRMDLVSREEFLRQQSTLFTARQEMSALLTQLDTLQQQLDQLQKTASSAQP